MWKERVVLENGVDAALVRRKCLQPLAAHPYLSGSRLLESGDQAKEGRFAGATFAEQREKFARSDVQRNVLQNFA